MKTAVLAIALMLCMAHSVTAQLAAADFDLDSVPHFAASHEVTLSGTGTQWTLAVPANASGRTYLLGVVITCDAACEVTQTQNGTHPTGTAVTNVLKLNLPTAASEAVLYSASDSTGGASLSATPLQAGIPQSFLMKVSFARGQPTPQNYSFSVNGITGKVRATWLWAQKR